MFVFRSFAAFCCVALVASGVSFAGDYKIVDLGYVGASGTAYGINNDGSTTGTGLIDGTSAYHPFLYQGGETIDLGGGAAGTASDINDAGEVVGGMYFGQSYRAFRWQGGVATELGTLGGSWSDAVGLNNYGQIVGTAYVSGAPTGGVGHGFVQSNGVMTDLGTLGGTGSRAYDINEAGFIVGGSGTTGDALWHATLIRPKNGEWYQDSDLDGINDLLVDLGTLGGRSLSDGADINDNGVVVGSSYDLGGGSRRAFKWQDGRMTELGALNGLVYSSAEGINNSGRIVGTSWSSWNADNRAFIWEDGAMYDLNGLVSPGSGWTLQYARAINDVGWIVGSGLSPGGDVHAYLLVPGPATGMLLGAGLAYLGLAQRRRSQQR